MIKIIANEKEGVELILVIDAEDLLRLDGQIFIRQVLSDFASYATRKSPDCKNLQPQIDGDELETF